VKNFLTALTGIAVITLFFLGINEIFLLFAAGLTVMGLENLRLRFAANIFYPLLVPGSLIFPTSSVAAASYATASMPVSLTKLTLFFLKIGSVLFGSGYVLLAFLRADLVERWKWLTEQQLLDAIAIGQFTPGPVFTTATFVGYIVAGSPGAILATIGIFLPAFVFVAVSNPLIPRLRCSPWAAGFLDGVNAASLGLMAAVTYQLGRVALVDWLTIIIALVTAVLIFRLNINSAWLVLAGGLSGLAYKLLE
jgi:chromate transporter